MKEDLEREFNEAADAVRRKGGLSVETQLLLYGLYKQATIGDCDVSQPSMWQFEAREKWKAWQDCRGKSQREAMQAYLDFIANLTPSQNAGISGKTVSTLALEMDEDDEDNDLPIIQAARSGDLKSLKAVLASDSTTLRCLDEENRSPLHWAADRGHLHICAFLIQAGADIDAQDLGGLTPLAYAVTCEHSDIVSILIEAGADPTIADNDGDTPLSIASATIAPLLQCPASGSSRKPS